MQRPGAKVVGMDTISLGELLRDWRQRRRLTQMNLAGAAGVSTRHMSFLETNRSLPSRALLLRLGAVLEMPLRERNRMLVAAGFAPMYREHRWDEQALAAARDAIERLLAGHEPYPALAVDRHWNLVSANSAAQRLMAGVPESLLSPPNVLRVSLHPHGLAPRIANLPQWRTHVLERLRQQHQTTQDPVLLALLEELTSYPGGEVALESLAAATLLVPLQMYAPDGQVLSLISTTTMFGTPNDVTLSELAIESFFPTDARTAEMLRALA